MSEFASEGSQAAEEEVAFIGASPDDPAPGENGDAIKDPSDWVSGDDPITDSQRSYLDSLARQAGETLPAELTKAQASEHIDRLRTAAPSRTCASTSTIPRRWRRSGRLPWA
jgi:hypothetical protein